MNIVILLGRIYKTLFYRLQVYYNRIHIKTGKSYLIYTLPLIINFIMVTDHIYDKKFKNSSHTEYKHLSFTHFISTHHCSITRCQQQIILILYFISSYLVIHLIPILEEANNF